MTTVAPQNHEQNFFSPFWDVLWEQENDVDTKRQVRPEAPTEQQVAQRTVDQLSDNPIKTQAGNRNVRPKKVWDAKKPGSIEAMPQFAGMPPQGRFFVPPMQANMQANMQATLQANPLNGLHQDVLDLLCRIEPSLMNQQNHVSQAEAFQLDKLNRTLEMFQDILDNTDLMSLLNVINRDGSPTKNQLQPNNNNSQQPSMQQLKEIQQLQQLLSSQNQQLHQLEQLQQVQHVQNAQHAAQNAAQNAQAQNFHFHNADARNNTNNTNKYVNHTKPDALMSQLMAIANYSNNGTTDETMHPANLNNLMSNQHNLFNNIGFPCELGMAGLGNNGLDSFGNDQQFENVMRSDAFYPKQGMAAQEEQATDYGSPATVSSPDHSGDSEPEPCRVKAEDSSSDPSDASPRPQRRARPPITYRNFGFKRSPDTTVSPCQPSKKRSLQLVEQMDGSSKRRRRKKTSKQMEVLRNSFLLDPKPEKNVLTHIATETRLTYQEVSRWFRNERHKFKKYKAGLSQQSTGFDKVQDDDEQEQSPQRRFHGMLQHLRPQDQLSLGQPNTVNGVLPNNVLRQHQHQQQQQQHLLNAAAFGRFDPQTLLQQHSQTLLRTRWPNLM